MSETQQLGLPLLQPAQAQKHVTVNEALVRLDGLTQLSIQSLSLPVPPTTAEDGITYSVPPGAVNAWSSNSGDLAIWSNGGWVFVTPKVGWQGYVVDQAKPVFFDGADWVSSALAMSENGAASLFEVLEFDHAISAGPSSNTTVQIPQYAMVFAVTGRVKTALTGAVTSFDVGVVGSIDRYSNGVGLAQGTWFNGVAGQPLTYWADTPLLLTANGGDFATGEVRLAIHYYHPTVPNL